MKLKDRIKSNVGGALEKAGGIGKKVAQDVSKNTLDLAQKAGKGAQIAGKSAKKGALGVAQFVIDEKDKADKKKYSAVFMDDYTAPDYNLPNLVMIVDDATSKHQKDIRAGSIGYRRTVKEVEVFHLYDETIPQSGLSFVPMPACDTLYYVDPHNRNRFIRLDNFFEKMQDGRVAELEHIAYSLGAKRYSIELFESEEEHTSRKQSTKNQGGKGIFKATVTAEQEETSESWKTKKVLSAAEITGDMTPVFPTLTWFAHDDQIKHVINMRCVEKGQNQLKRYSFTFEGSQFSSMSKSMASKIDAAANKLGSASMGFQVRSKASKEHRQTMIFQIEFE